MKEFRLLVLLILVSAVSCQKSLDEEEIEASFSNGIPEGIASYFKSEMSSQIASVESISNDNCLVLNILTDNHISSDPTNIRGNINTLRNLSYLNSQTRVDGVVHIGDIVAQSLSSSDGFSDENIFSVMKDYVSLLNETCSKVYIINGNHDGKSANLYDEEMWLNIVRPFNDSYVNRYEDTPYFYVDYPKQNLRCVFLALPDKNTDNTPYYGYTARCLKWLVSDAFNVEDDTDIIIFGHLPTITASYMSSGHTINLNSFAGLCNAYNDHAKYSDNLISCDYTANQKSRILAYVTGHLHTDLVVEPGYEYEGKRNMSTGKEAFTYKSHLDFPEILIGHNYFNGATDQATSLCGGTNYKRSLRSANQDLWDTMIYDPTEHKLSFIRFGAGEDRILDVSQAQ